MIYRAERIIKYWLVVNVTTSRLDPFHYRILNKNFPILPANTIVLFLLSDYSTAHVHYFLCKIYEHFTDSASHPLLDLTPGFFLRSSVHLDVGHERSLRANEDVPFRFCVTVRCTLVWLALGNAQSSRPRFFMGLVIL